MGNSSKVRAVCGLSQNSVRGRVGGFSGSCYLVMVIFLRTVHFVLAAVDLVILTAMFLKVPSEGGRGWMVLNLFWKGHY